MSVLHRATGIALTVGLFVLTWWLMAAASGPEAYESFRHIAGSFIGLFVLAGLSLSAFYHLCTGIRHLVLDTGAGFSIPEIYKSGYTALFCAVILTALFWAAILF